MKRPSYLCFFFGLFLFSCTTKKEKHYTSAVYIKNKTGFPIRVNLVPRNGNLSLYSNGKPKSILEPTSYKLAKDSNQLLYSISGRAIQPATVLNKGITSISIEIINHTNKKFTISYTDSNNYKDDFFTNNDVWSFKKLFLENYIEDAYSMEIHIKKIL